VRALMYALCLFGLRPQGFTNAESAHLRGGPGGRGPGDLLCRQDDR
jgi:hypothetical protein